MYGPEEDCPLGSVRGIKNIFSCRGDSDMCCD